MKILKKSMDYTSILKKSVLFLCYLIFNHLEKTVMPYSAAIYVTALYSGSPILSSSILFVLSFLIGNGLGLLGSVGIACIVMMTTTFIHRKLKLKPSVAFSFYSILAILGFVLLGNTINQIPFYTRALVSVFTVILTLISVIAGKAIVEKGLKFKLGFEEFATIAIMVALFGLGVCNLLSPIVWKAVSILILLYVCYLFKLGTATLISCVLGLSLSIYYANINYVSVFLVLSLSAESLMKLSRFISAPAVILADYLCFILFHVYGAYGVREFSPVLIGCSVFILTPSLILKKLKEKLYTFRERQLVRQTINRNRLMLSNKLYELSGVFLEMSNAFNLFQERSMNDEQAKNAIEKQIYSTVCRECENYARCKKNESNILIDLSKMTDIGFAKGKLTLIDMPRILSSTCTRPNNILYGLNKLLADFRAYKLDSENVKNGRDLVAAEASGIAEILRSLALETGETLKYQSRLERKLSDNLFKSGFTVTEILIYGEGERVSVGMIVAMPEFSVAQLQSIVSKTLSKPMLLTEKADITEDKCYLSFNKAADYDAVFGIAKVTKDGSDTSGDTHSVMRISGDRFLVALSDGMGSGKHAESISSTSLSLIECFYKAGLKSNLILNTVNTLLAINTEDSFTALDISVIDLKSCTADFIKYGSPYGFILNDNGIKIVEGNSLPIGIVEQLKPSVCSSTLCNGDVILLLSDGISDAFGSSGEIIDFLRTLPAKNPQTLANQVLEHALELNGGAKKDDMTALAVRIFKRSA
ncbi:MAG: SpoIIE family protein phosphatase [Clostridia bacterium]|nr:SpoIIE family protein phosphatase [Clostridia bacterium]